MSATSYPGEQYEHSSRKCTKSDGSGDDEGKATAEGRDARTAHSKLNSEEGASNLGQRQEIDPLHAHSRNQSGLRHGLVDHLRAVSSLAGSFAEVFGARAVAEWSGLVHDAGKADWSWQQRLLEVEGTDTPVGIDHKRAGTQFLLDELGFDAFALIVHGHHGGLKRPAEMTADLESQGRQVEHEADAWARLRPLLPELRNPAPPPWPDWARKGDLDAELLARMLFSALIDADRLDTQVHLGKRDRHIDQHPEMAHLLDRYERNRKQKISGGAPAPIDPLRNEVYNACVEAASLPSGFFKLAAPTGLGKTMAAGGFALHHAAAQGLRRVVMAVPFVTVTEQNASTYRGLLGHSDRERIVLEQHSSINLEGGQRRWQRLAAENWDAPFIVTTTVQLLESLHSNNPSKMRKLHRLARSVIVLDEIQSLPVHLLIPILTMLRQLVEHLGVTVLLSSATQPEFWDLAPLREVHPVEILPDPVDLQRRVGKVRRMVYRWMTEPKPSLKAVARAVVDQPEGQVLTVANTVGQARVLFEEIRELAPPGTVVRHLSTRMCGAHRASVLAEVIGLLGAKDAKPLQLVSTQLIEAGVDIDFPVVYRAFAPADSQLQAAGRANRSGRRKEGLVVVFDPKEGGMPASYGLPTQETRRLFGEGRAALDDLAALARYYRSYYGVLSPFSMGLPIVRARERWDFPGVADDFHMIEEDSVPVVVRYRDPARAEPDPVDEWLARTRRDPAHGWRYLEKLQPYIVSLRRSHLDKPEIAPLLVPVIGDLFEWVGDYDEFTGLQLPAPKE